MKDKEFNIEGFVQSGKLASIQYTDRINTKLESPENGHIATHYLSTNENLSRTIAISRFNSSGSSPTEFGHNFLVYVLDKEIHQVVNFLKLLRSGGNNE